jgi:G2/mitotic-specific cyclin-B, other
LVGVSALLIACKYEEIYPPELKDFVFITDRAYTKEDVLTMEFLILSSLSFELSFPTSFRFLERYMRILGEDANVMMMSLFFMELSLVDVRMIEYPNSIIAAAAVC